jgi:cell division septation protein DedD
MIGPMSRRSVIVVLAAVAFGGCGDQPRLSSRSADELHAQVAAVREAAADDDRARALEALDGLAGRVRELEDDGSLAEADADALLRGIGRARRRVRAEIAEPTPTSTPTPTPTPTATATATPTPTPTATPAAPEGNPGKDKGNGKAKGKKGKGD